jgi:protein-disulfide isomerase
MQGFFLTVSFTISAMPNKSKMTPLVVIIAAIAVAGAIAVYMTQQSSTAEPVDNTQTAAMPSSGAAAGGGGRVRGPADAAVTLVEYGDYQCPTCKAYHPITMELLSRYGGKLKFEYHHYPLISIHPNAMPAALAAEAAADQGKFWEMHDLLFEYQEEWSGNPNAEAQFLQYALRLGLDSNRFMQSMRSPDTQSRVLADVTRGNAFVQGTPTFLINGQMVHELVGLNGLAEMIDRHLQSTPQ